MQNFSRYMLLYFNLNDSLLFHFLKTLLNRYFYHLLFLIMHSGLMLLTIFIGHLEYHLSFYHFIPLFFLTPIKL